MTIGDANPHILSALGPELPSDPIAERAAEKALLHSLLVMLQVEIERRQSA